MDDLDALAQQFEEMREHLRGVAYRMLGSTGEAEDAVQETWLRLSRTDTAGVANLGGWLTTVVSRVCLDLLRSRSLRAEHAGDVEAVVATTGDGRPGPEQEAVLADMVGRAVLVVLDALTPAERVAFVLHDTFGVSFDEIARVVDRTPVAARQLASRARRRVRGWAPEHAADSERQREVIEAFLRAARHGDLEAVVAALAPDVVFRSDDAAAALGDVPARIEGADAVAAVFAGRARAARVALVDGSLGVMVVRGGRTLVLLDVVVDDGRIVAIDAVADPDRLDHAEIVVLDQ